MKKRLSSMENSEREMKDRERAHKKQTKGINNQYKKLAKFVRNSFEKIRVKEDKFRELDYVKSSLLQFASETAFNDDYQMPDRSTLLMRQDRAKAVCCRIAWYCTLNLNVP